MKDSIINEEIIKGYVSTNQSLADILTDPLRKETFFLRNVICILLTLKCIRSGGLLEIKDSVYCKSEEKKYSFT